MGMPINSVASGSATQQLHGAGAWQQRRQSFDTLAKALQSGDLNAAKQAYSSLASSFPQGVANNPNSPLAKLGQALQTGDLSAVQTAFAAMRGGHHHRGNDGDGDDGSSINTSAVTTGPGGGLIGSNVNTVA